MAAVPTRSLGALEVPPIGFGVMVLSGVYEPVDDTTAEQLSAAGVPVFLTDIKGDVSGMATAGVANDRITSRTQDIGQQWAPAAFPVERPPAWVLATTHPSAVLRADDRRSAYDAFVADLRIAAARATS